MTCCKLIKTIPDTSEVLIAPGIPGTPGTPGTLGSPAHCVTTPVTTCTLQSNPALSYKWVCSPNPYYPQHSTNPQICDWESYYNGVGISGSLVQIPVMVNTCTTTQKYTCYPAIPGTPGTPAIPGTPAQYKTVLNLGWNSWSRSITSLSVGDYLMFTASPAAYGIFIGLWLPGEDGKPIPMFPHGMILDIAGVHIYESGVNVHTLVSSYTSSTVFKILRNTDNSIDYYADSTVYNSLVSASGSDDLCVYTYLYSAGDTLLCASFNVIATDAADSGTSVSTDLDMTGAEMLPEVSSFGSANSAYCIGGGYLPELYADIDGTMAYIPPTPSMGYETLPILLGAGIVITSSDGTAAEMLPELVSLGGAYAYGVAQEILPELYGFGAVEDHLVMNILDGMWMGDTQLQQRNTVFVFNSNCELTSVYSGTLVQIQQYLSSLIGASVHIDLGTYSTSWISSLNGISLELMNIGSIPDINTGGRVWVVNVDTAATTRYADYAFNSFFTREGIGYGVASDGVYQLSGDTDSGELIDAFLAFGETRLGSVYDKRLPAVYINVMSENRMILMVEVDESAPVYYEARTNTDVLDITRVDIGRGLKGANWTFTLLNKDGCDFNLSTLEFTPVKVARRI